MGHQLFVKEIVRFDIEVLSSDKILIAGLYYTGSFFSSNTYIFLVQLNLDGSFDNSFSTDGKSIVVCLQKNVARARNQPDGKIIAGIT